MGEFAFIETNIEGVIVIETKAFYDNRGFFAETYSGKDFLKLGFSDQFVQDNLSRSKKGVLRGMHYQINPSPMGKLVRCVRGKIFDVGVDVRKGSKTFGRWYGDILSSENMKMIYFPPGIAHGFLSIEDDTYVYYKCTGLYSKKNERAIIWNDANVKIAWPLKEVPEVILSERDQNHPCLKDADIF